MVKQSVSEQPKQRRVEKCVLNEKTSENHAYARISFSFIRRPYNIHRMPKKDLWRLSSVWVKEKADSQNKLRIFRFFGNSFVHAITHIKSSNLQSQWNDCFETHKYFVLNMVYYSYTLSYTHTHSTYSHI